MGTDVTTKYQITQNGFFMTIFVSLSDFYLNTTDVVSLLQRSSAGSIVVTDVWMYAG